MNYKEKSLNKWLDILAKLREIQVTMAEACGYCEHHGYVNGKQYPDCDACTLQTRDICDSHRGYEEDEPRDHVFLAMHGVVTAILESLQICDGIRQDMGK